MGAIYALERIAWDSERDHWPVMEILTTYVRTRAPATEHQPHPEDYQPPVDIQAVLTVIGRRREEHRKAERSSLDLRRTDLCRANLNDAHLEHATFADAHLEHAYFLGTLLERSFFIGTRLDGARFWSARLDHADFRGTHLEGADFRGPEEEGTYRYRATGLTVAQLNEAYGDETTKLPDYIDREQVTWRKG